MKVFIESQFGYWPLVWMFWRRQTHARINHVHERALRAVHNDEVSPFEKLLKKDKSETIHQRNIKVGLQPSKKIVSFASMKSL